MVNLTHDKDRKIISKSMFVTEPKQPPKKPKI